MPIVPSPEPSEAPKRPRRAPKATDEPLSDQIGNALLDLKKEHGISGLARLIGVTPNTVVRVMSGVGLKLSTVELICEKLGWGVTITDEDGNVIARV
jgi:hypothetical protein